MVLDAYVVPLLGLAIVKLDDVKRIQINFGKSIPCYINEIEFPFHIF